MPSNFQVLKLRIQTPKEDLFVHLFSLPLLLFMKLRKFCQIFEVWKVKSVKAVITSHFNYGDSDSFDSFRNLEEQWISKKQVLIAGTPESIFAGRTKTSLKFLFTENIEDYCVRYISLLIVILIHQTPLIQKLRVLHLIRFGLFFQ